MGRETALWTLAAACFLGISLSAQATLRDPAAGATIFTAIQEELGLRLEATKGPVQVVVSRRSPVKSYRAPVGQVCMAKGYR